MQTHLAGSARRSGKPKEDNLIVRPSAVVATDLDLLAREDSRYWVQGVDDVDEADWALFEALKEEPGFKPPLMVNLRALVSNACALFSFRAASARRSRRRSRRLLALPVSATFWVDSRWLGASSSSPLVPRPLAAHAAAASRRRRLPRYPPRCSPRCPMPRRRRSSRTRWPRPSSTSS